ncbi:alpha/beta hydrolase [Rhodococcus corynebacterioides]|nr:alpha/beta hydrolase [Rhodococcus corynebacterioides]
MKSRDSELGPDSRFAAVDGLQMHYTRRGSGPVVVLLHGSGSAAHGVAEVAELLQGDFDVVCPDLPGFGLTGPRPDRDYRASTYCHSLARFLDAIDVPRCVLAGNSLGGNIAWNVAVEYPERVSALVLINATGYTDKGLPSSMALLRNPLVALVLRHRMPRRAVERSLRGAVGKDDTMITDDVVTRAHRLWNRRGNAAAFVDFVNTDQPDRSSLVSAVSSPTLILRSADMDGQHFHRDISDSVEKVHPFGGHLLPQEDPRWVAQAMSTYLLPRRNEL